MFLGPILRPNSGEASDDLNEMDRLPLIHIVADLIREKNKGTVEPCQSATI